MNRCPAAGDEKVREDGWMKKEGKRCRNGDSKGMWGRGVRTCQGCHAMPGPDLAPADGR